jgi:hypothetical protein
LEVADNEFAILVGRQELQGQPAVTNVSACYPNPFRDGTTIKLYLEKPARVSVQISDVTGKSLSAMEKGLMGTGNHWVTMDGKGLLPGIYFYTVLIDNVPFTGKMVKR